MTVAQLEAASAEVRRQACQLLDQISRPMTVRELDEALRITPLSRRERRLLIRGLRGFAVIAIADDPARLNTSLEGETE